jgi:RNA polymerase sigma-70 factor (ECF subfamily)
MGIPRADIERLYDELGPALLAYARSIVRDAGEAEDALQEVFVKLMTRNPALPREPRPYLFRAVRNTCLNRRRATAREASGPDIPPMFLETAGPPGLARDIEDALNALPQEQRQVVVLRVWAEMTFEEAAHVLEIPANTAASRYRYALEKLRQRFGALVRS